jgi:hypothetical protein
MNAKSFLLTLCGLALGWAGCIGTVDGKHQAGVPFINDTVESRYERPLEKVWIAAKDVLNQNGVMTVENVIGKTLEAKVDNCTVWIMVDSVSPELTRVFVEVRTKGGGTNKRLASELDKQIAVRLASGNLAPATAPPKAGS